MSFSLTLEEKIFLLKLARKSIRSFLDQQKREYETYFSETLKSKSGAFVTLHHFQALRGCIGYVKPFKALQDAISDLAVSAAFNDPRFPALSAEEFAEVELEISVLTPLKKTADINEIEIGRDGLLLKNGLKEGLLLPQVATEYGWDRTTFLEQTGIKAGLGRNSWKNEATEIYRFSAIIFDESLLPAGE